MGNIKLRSHKVGATLSEATSVQFYSGPCSIEAISVDYAATADAGTDITIYDGFSTSGRSVYSDANKNTDFGTTVPNFITGDADLVAGTSTAGVGHGVGLPVAALYQRHRLFEDEVKAADPSPAVGRHQGGTGAGGELRRA